MRHSGFFTILFLSLLILVAGAVGYQAGLTSHAVASGATVVVASGFPGFESLLLLLLLGFALFAFVGGRRGRWGSLRGRGPWAGWTGPGSPGAFGPFADPSDPRREWIAALHRSLHEDGSTGNAARTSSTSA